MRDINMKDIKLIQEAGTKLILKELNKINDGSIDIKHEKNKIFFEKKDIKTYIELIYCPHKIWKYSWILKGNDKELSEIKFENREWMTLLTIYREFTYRIERNQFCTEKQIKKLIKESESKTKDNEENITCNNCGNNLLKESHYVKCDSCGQTLCAGATNGSCWHNHLISEHEIDWTTIYLNEKDV